MNCSAVLKMNEEDSDVEVISSPLYRKYNCVSIMFWQLCSRPRSRDAGVRWNWRRKVVFVFSHDTGVQKYETIICTIKIQLQFLTSAKLKPLCFSVLVFFNYSSTWKLALLGCFGGKCEKVNMANFIHFLLLGKLLSTAASVTTLGAFFLIQQQVSSKSRGRNIIK